MTNCEKNICMQFLAHKPGVAEITCLLRLIRVIPRVSLTVPISDQDEEDQQPGRKQPAFSLSKSSVPGASIWPLRGSGLSVSCHLCVFSTGFGYAGDGPNENMHFLSFFKCSGNIYCIHYKMFELTIELHVHGYS